MKNIAEKEARKKFDIVEIKEIIENSGILRLKEEDILIVTVPDIDTNVAKHLHKILKNCGVKNPIIVVDEDMKFSVIRKIKNGQDPDLE